jgi:peptide/nickel transport system ATP-binding protein
MIFQNPDTALDPRMTVGATVREAITAGRRVGRGEQRHECDRLLDLVSLEPRLARELPSQLSGGQKQRVAIARALAIQPRVLVADEITSALDASVQGAILNLLKQLQDTLGLSVIFIGHNLAAVRFVSDRIAVMYLGAIVEEGATDALLAHPQHPYTESLVAAVPSLSGESRGRTLLGEPGDLHSPPAGCTFHPRCPVGPVQRPDREVCREQSPRPGADGRLHRAACHFAATSPDADAYAESEVDAARHGA